MRQGPIGTPLGLPADCRLIPGPMVQREVLLGFSRGSADELEESGRDLLEHESGPLSTVELSRFLPLTMLKLSFKKCTDVRPWMVAAVVAIT